MIYTTRNPREAEAFVDSLPLSNKLKEAIKGSFDVTTRIHAEIKKKYSSNSKGAERIFMSRMQELIPKHLNRLVEDFHIEGYTDIDEMRMICMVPAANLAVFEFSKEIGVDEGLLNELLEYIELCKKAMDEMTPDIDGEDDDY